MSNTGIQLSNVTLEKNEGGIVSLHVEVAPETVQEARARVIKDFSRRIRVPGFRPGSVPAGIVRRNVGDEAIAQEVADALIGPAYEAAAQQENVRPLEQAQVDQLSFDAFDGDKPLSFVARVIARPEIELGSTEGLEATKRTVAVSDEDVEGALENMRQEAAYLKNVEPRPVQEGDVLFAEIQVYIDGEPRSPEPATVRGFMVGQSGFVPPIDEHLIGMELDQTHRFAVTYPEDFPESELASREAEFEVKVTAIKERVVPELSDEFAQIRQAKDVADLREKLTEFLLATGERDARREVRESLVESVAKTSTLEVPSALVDLRVQERIASIEQELQSNNATIESYLQAINSTREQLENDLREELENEVKIELVLDEIAEREGFPVEMTEIEQHYLLMANATNTPPEELVRNVPVHTVRTSILQRKAIDLLVAKSIIKTEDGEVVSLEAPILDDEAQELIESAEPSALEDGASSDDANDQSVIANEPQA